MGVFRPSALPKIWGVVLIRRYIRLGLILLCGLLVSLLFQTASVPTVGVPIPIQPATATWAKATTSGDGLKPFAEVTQDFTVTTGLFKLYHQPQTHRTLLGLRPDQLNKNLLLITTLASGVGEAGLLRGLPVNDGLPIQFRAAPNDRLQVVVPNFFFRDSQGQPLDRQTLADSFSDSVLFALPILSRHPDSGEMLIDLTEFLIDQDPANVLATFPWIASNYSVNADLSYLGQTQVFPENVEMEVVLGLSGGDGSADPFGQGLGSLPDQRGFSLRVRHSLSALPSHPSFQPRPADQRVGYFITAYRTAERRRSPDPTVRYIQRWHLEKQDPTAALSPPKQPIVFWLENTIPQEYRAAIRDGVEWWNAAFEQAGFLRAIQVEQMPDNAPWDPADVRYNVIRWSDSFQSTLLGIGPSRVNPLTGEILDADVILDASAISYANQQYQTLGPAASPEVVALGPLCQSGLVRSALRRRDTLATAPASLRLFTAMAPTSSGAMAGVMADGANFCTGLAGLNQMAFGHLALSTLGSPLANRATQETYVQDFLRTLTAHEVGHVLGLRHNFVGSVLRSPEELHNPEVTRTQGMITSIMDYLPPNVAPPGSPQGDFFPSQLGAYDRWAIEYGYRPTSNPVAAQRELQAIADRASDPQLAYAPDEDIYDVLDPKANPWDWSHDPLGYAAGQMALAQSLWSQLDWFSLNPGEGYGLLRQRVDLVFGHYLSQALVMANYIGGQRFLRTDPWSSRGQSPFQPIAAADQRRALDLLSEYLFAADAVQLSPDLVRLLAPDRWWHQGQQPTIFPLDYPLASRVLDMQAIALSDLFYGDRLARLSSADLHTSGDHLSLTELFDRLTQAIWGEWIAPTTDPFPASSLRRGLQRFHLDLLTQFLAPSPTAPATLLDWLAQETTRTAPADARLMARHQLRQIHAALQTYHRHHADRLDSLSRAHLEDVTQRIDQALSATHPNTRLHGGNTKGHPNVPPA